jgi:hypothetical protein
MHRLFQEFLRENETEYGDLIYHTEIRWLSRGNVLQRFFILRSEIREFLQKDRKEKPRLENKYWLYDLALLTDITGHLNHFNSQLQGKTQLISDIFNTVRAFLAKLLLFKTQLVKGDLSHFPTCKELFLANETTRKAQSETYVAHVEKLELEFDGRSSQLKKKRQAKLSAIY